MKPAEPLLGTLGSDDFAALDPVEFLSARLGIPIGLYSPSLCFAQPSFEYEMVRFAVTEARVILVEESAAAIEFAT